MAMAQRCPPQPRLSVSAPVFKGHAAHNYVCPSGEGSPLPTGRLCMDPQSGLSSPLLSWEGTGASAEFPGGQDRGKCLTARRDIAGQGARAALQPDQRGQCRWGRGGACQRSLSVPTSPLSPRSSRPSALAGARRPPVQNPALPFSFCQPLDKPGSPLSLSLHQCLFHSTGRAVAWREGWGRVLHEGSCS